MIPDGLRNHSGCCREEKTPHPGINPQFSSSPARSLFSALSFLPINIDDNTLEIDEELCVCFIDWQKAFDLVNWTKLTHCGQVTQICVFTLQLCRTDDGNLRF